MSSFKLTLPEKYNAQEAESRIQAQWDNSRIFCWDKNAPREKTFVVDTPPPTASGSLHMGHMFSYTQTDVLVRYHRQRQKNIFYPMGWDDNGLPTERRVQNYFGIRCNPRLPYDPSWKADLAMQHDGKSPVKEVSRRNFIEACSLLTGEDEKNYERFFRRLALSVDWSLQYATIDDHCRRISQLSFLDLVNKGQAFSNESPTMWDVDFRSAIAQAEIEDREIAGAYHEIRFGVEGGGEFTIATTRPELLAACVAVVAHPDDARFKKLFGKKAITPLFHSPVPILPAGHADPEKGTGILMVCTFGDILDVSFWKQSGLAAKPIIGLDGRLLAVAHGPAPFVSVNPDKANAAYGTIAGLTVKQAQKKIVELLAQEESGVTGAKALVGEPKPVSHPVKFYEKGDRPIEFLTTRQWFIKILDHKDDLVKQGRKISWHPEHMLSRYENWVTGLNQDWCISRQRYFGVAIPAWYPVSADGNPDYSKPIFPDPKLLPIDPLSDIPSGFNAEQRDKPGGFAGDPDVMDTWATSAMTPQIESFWQIDSTRHKLLFPMDMRPQAHDIIRTWAFYTILKAWLHEKEIPWKHAAISGFILDPDRKKMSKSKGNVVTPEPLLEKYSSDAVRYSASRSRLGLDASFDESLFKIGLKLTTKLYNASRFVLMQFDRLGISPQSTQVKDITEELDQGVVRRLRDLVTAATKLFDDFEYAAALQLTEDAFWNFCDNYLELVKVRSYGEQDSPGRRSALATLSWSLKTFLRLLGPVIPHVTEEIWANSYKADGPDRSITTSVWPSIDEIKVVAQPAHAVSYDAASEIIGKIRGAKTAAQKNLKWPILSANITCSASQRLAVESVLSDIVRGGNISGPVSFVESTAQSSQIEVEAILAQEGA
jgi:valyl-tRNA synthetase